MRSISISQSSARASSWSSFSFSSVSGIVLEPGGQQRSAAEIARARAQQRELQLTPRTRERIATTASAWRVLSLDWRRRFPAARRFSLSPARG